MQYCSFIFLLLLVGCTADKQKLEGKRESFIAIQEAIKPDPNLKDHKVTISSPKPISNWSQVGGKADHVMPVIQVGNGEKLKLLWKKSIGVGGSDYHRLITHPIIHDDIIYTIDAKTHLRAWKVSDGQLLWEKDLSPTEYESSTHGGGLAADNDNLYVTSPYGEVYCFEAKSGKKLWEKSLQAPLRAAPTVYNNRLLVLTVNNEVISLNTKNGEEIWEYAGIIESNSLLGGSSPAVNDMAAVVALTSGEVFGFSPESGSLLWANTLMPSLRVDTVSGIAHIRARPVINGNTTFVASHGGKLAAYDLITGNQKWLLDVGALRTPAFNNGFLFIVTTNDELLCVLGKTGQVKWAVNLPRQKEGTNKPVTWAGPILINQDLLLVGTNGNMITVDPQNGEIKQTYILGSAVQLSPIAADNTLFVLLDNGILQAWR